MEPQRVLELFTSLKAQTVDLVTALSDILAWVDTWIKVLVPELPQGIGWVIGKATELVTALRDFLV
jgi:hypothetical protein